MGKSEKIEEFDFYHLDNGITVIHKSVTNSKVAHCGFILNVGTRDEEIDEQGIAHFWEHMAFKGTKKRKAYHLINRLEVVGGELNAFTTKEKMFFYASFLDRHYERSFELLTDITFNSTFPDKEIEKEKGVIIEEMAMYQDSPDELLFDQFDEQLFDGHPLGKNILGTEESVQSFTHDDFVKFARRNLTQGQVAFVSVGNVSFSKVKKYADKYLSIINLPEKIDKKVNIWQYKPSVKTFEKNIVQSHVIMGMPALSVTSKDRVPLFMLSHLLGGPNLSSRLNMSLREKKGLVYSTEAFYHTFTDQGLFGVYYSTDHKNLRKAEKLVSKEFEKLKTRSLGKLQLANLKDQLCGQLAMAEESNSGILQVMGKSYFDLKRIESLKEIFDQINQVSSSKIMELSNDFLDEENLSKLTFEAKPNNGIS